MDLSLTFGLGLDLHRNPDLDKYLGLSLGISLDRATLEHRDARAGRGGGAVRAGLLGGVGESWEEVGEMGEHEEL